MTNLLVDWATTAGPTLKRLGYLAQNLEIGESLRATSVSVNSENFVGAISHWQPCTFEFQFNDCASGDVVLLETLQFESLDSLSRYIENALQKLNLGKLGSGEE